MRILSQDGETNIPYEISNIYIIRNVIYASNAASSRLFLGEYENDEETKKIFDYLFRICTSNIGTFIMPKRGVFADEEAN